MKLSIVQLVGSGAVRAESAACLLVVAAADSRHRLDALLLHLGLILDAERGSQKDTLVVLVISSVCVQKSLRLS